MKMKNFGFSFLRRGEQKRLGMRRWWVEEVGARREDGVGFSLGDSWKWFKNQKGAFRKTHQKSEKLKERSEIEEQNKVRGRE